MMAKTLENLFWTDRLIAFLKDNNGQYYNISFADNALIPQNEFNTVSHFLIDEGLIERVSDY